MTKLMNDNKVKDRRYLIGFSVTGSLITILFFAFINFSTGVRFPWFIFPAYAVLWWPLATICSGRRAMKALSLIGSLATIALLFVTNYLTSWNYPWFIFPSFAVLWWPISAFFGARGSKIFSAVGSVLVIAFFAVTNYITSPAQIWFYYPAFAVIWWPLSVFLAKPKTIKVYSVLGALTILSFLTFENVLRTPGCPWALFAFFPVLMWPVCIILGKHMKKLSMSVFFSILGIAYYTALNILVFKGFPWAVFPAYALLWWPLSAAFAKKGRLLLFSVIGSVLSAVFFSAVNFITTPQNVWAVYPIFVLVWWPLSTYYFVFRNKPTV